MSAYSKSNIPFTESNNYGGIAVDPNCWCKESDFDKNCPRWQTRSWKIRYEMENFAQLTWGEVCAKFFIYSFRDK